MIEILSYAITAGANDEYNQTCNTSSRFVSVFWPSRLRIEQPQWLYSRYSLRLGRNPVCGECGMSTFLFSTRLADGSTVGSFQSFDFGCHRIPPSRCNMYPRYHGLVSIPKSHVSFAVEHPFVSMLNIGSGTHRSTILSRQ